MNKIKKNINDYLLNNLTKLNNFKNDNKSNKVRGHPQGRGIFDSRETSMRLGECLALHGTTFGCPPPTTCGTNSSPYKNKILQLKKDIKEIYELLYKFETKYNDLYKEYLFNNLELILEKSNNIKSSYVKLNKQIKNQNSFNNIPQLPVSKNIVDDLNLDCIIINTIEDIPNNYIYYIKNINKYGIKINNTLLLGNLTNITNKSTNNTKKCIYQNNCKNLINKNKCDYYHSNLNINNINKIYDINNLLYKEKYIYNSSCLYTFDILSEKNKFMKHIGNKNTFKNDLELMIFNYNIPKYKYIIDNEIDNIRVQTINNLLTYLLVKKYIK